jgi:hypothetical protein
MLLVRLSLKIGSLINPNMIGLIKLPIFNESLTSSIKQRKN